MYSLSFLPMTAFFLLLLFFILFCYTPSPRQTPSATILFSSLALKSLRFSMNSRLPSHLSAVDGDYAVNFFIPYELILLFQNCPIGVLYKYVGQYSPERMHGAEIWNFSNFYCTYILLFYTSIVIISILYNIQSYFTWADLLLSTTVYRAMFLAIKIYEKLDSLKLMHFFSRKNKNRDHRVETEKPRGPWPC